MCKVIEDMRMESFQEGIREGKKEVMKAVALRMLKAGKYTLDEIVSISGLSLNEVRELSVNKTI